MATGARALIALHRGEPEGSEPATGYLAALAVALRRESEGSPRVALEVLASVWDSSLAAGLLTPCLAVAPDLVRLSRAVGDMGRARDASAVIDRTVAANPGVGTIAATGLRCRGLVTDEAGPLVEAAAMLRDLPRPLDFAVACEDAGESLGRSGRTAEARAWFDDALRSYERLDAGWDRARATARMRALGLRRAGRPAGTRPKVGWDALTRGERAVVELVADGLSNPEVAERLYLSRHTVKRHLANAMLKLGLSSRFDLAREAVRPEA
jgi:DNA-binding CsgD family transcriptional regulator